ncbi:anthrone oxygenase family protein [Streptomyces sp. NPDC005134]|uniref:anthrone oxygenase family protein n=1 Tax=Streptomyces sp. NPDC005098 TaxID=3154560 RepID=UPI00339FF7B4
MASLLLALATFTTGLYAGFLVCFMIGIMPGLKSLPDDQFAAAMRRFNEKVPGPVFLVLFLGVIAFPVAALVVPVDGRTSAEGGLVAGALACAVLSHLVTVGGNIPLNSALAASEGGGGDDGAARRPFESRWNTLHRMRTVLSTGAFALLVAAAV